LSSFRRPSTSDETRPHRPSSSASCSSGFRSVAALGSTSRSPRTATSRRKANAQAITSVGAHPAPRRSPFECLGAWGPGSSGPSSPVAKDDSPRRLVLLEALSRAGRAGRAARFRPLGRRKRTLLHRPRRLRSAGCAVVPDRRGGRGMSGVFLAHAWRWDFGPVMAFRCRSWRPVRSSGEQRQIDGYLQQQGGPADRTTGQ
jgi:hypothetical protein